MTQNYREHPEWSSERRAGDREVAVYLADADGTVTITVGGDYGLFRPSDIRAKLHEMNRLAGCNFDRWEQLATILENEPDYWLHIGW